MQSKKVTLTLPQTAERRGGCAKEARATYMPSKNTSAPIIRLVKPGRSVGMCISSPPPPTQTRTKILATHWSALTQQKRRLASRGNGTRDSLGQQRSRVLPVHHIRSDDGVEWREAGVPRRLTPWQLLHAAHVRHTAFAHVGLEQLHHTGREREDGAAACGDGGRLRVGMGRSPADVGEQNVRCAHARCSEAFEAETSAKQQDALAEHPVRLIHKQLR
jgi:hypothetical protein